MSYYTQGIHNKQINPTTNSTNFRTEFRLNDPSTIYLTDMRLCNVGFSTESTPKSINELNGVNSVIKNLTLYDGNVVLDQVLNYQLYSGFKCYNKTNDDALSTNHFLKKNNLGFITQGQVDGTTDEQLINIYDPVLTSTNSDTTSTAWISLKDYLPLLDESLYLPTQIYKDLRLVIEYNTNQDDLMPNSADSITTTPPFLIVNELTNQDAMMNILKQYNGVVFRPLEHSRVTVPVLNPTAANPNPAQDVTFTLTSFNNKTLQRLLMIKTPVSTSSDAYGQLGSISQHKEETQVNINGANLLPQNGLTTRNEAKAMLYDLWGDCVDLCGASWLPDATNAVANADDVLGQLDYRSVMVENFVQDFQVQFKRQGQYKTGTSDANQKFQQYNQALQLNMFGEVNKVVVVNPDNTYLIRYA